MVHPGGRPTEYKEEYIQKADEYLKSHKDQNDENNKLTVKLPTIEGFAIYLGVSKKVLYTWEKDYPEFLHALGKIRQEQHDRLINNGLAGTYNPTIAKLVLSSNHGYKEKSDVTSDGKALPAPILGGIIKEDEAK